MSNSEQQIEQEIQAKGLNAPRITPEYIDSKIKHAEYILPRDVCRRDNGVETFDAPLPLQTLTFCILTLENGFTVTGESACVSPENFDADIGKGFAYDNAREKIWVLEGYLLKQRLHEQPAGIDGIGAGIVGVSHSNEVKSSTSLSFSQALSALKEGHRVARIGWNGKDQYVVAQAQTTSTDASKIWNPHNKAHAEKLGGSIDVAPYCTLKTAQDTLAMGWTPSTGDLFASDWVILD